MRFTPSKEQQPPSPTEAHPVQGGVKKDPERHYHYFGTDKVAKEFEREGRAKDLGYDKEHSRTSRQVLMSCPKEAHLARRQKAMEADAIRRKQVLNETITFNEPGASGAAKEPSGYEVGKIDD